MTHYSLQIKVQLNSSVYVHWLDTDWGEKEELKVTLKNMKYTVDVRDVDGEGPIKKRKIFIVSNVLYNLLYFYCMFWVANGKKENEAMYLRI